MDIELTVISNTDNDVINLSEHGVFKSIKGGTTTVEISNDGGLLKKLDLTVVEQTIESINLKIYSSHLYVGSEYTIYSYITPGNAIDELEFNVDNPEIAEVVVDDRGYANLVCKSVGEVKVTANSKKNPDVNVTYTYKVTAKLDEDTLKKADKSTLKSIFNGYNSFAGNVSRKASAISNASKGAGSSYTSKGTYYSKTAASIASGKIDKEV